jgi:uncharacterized linocin/CFP29 family protein
VPGAPLVCPGLEGGVALSLRGGDFVLDRGEDLSIGDRDHAAEVVRLCVEETFSFRVLEPDAAVALRMGERRSSPGPILGDASGAGRCR